MATPFIQILPDYEAAHEFNQILPDDKAPHEFIQVLPNDEAVQFIQVLPGEKSAPRAAPVADEDWELHKEQISKWWYQQGFSREEIQKLLKAAGLSVTTDQLWRKMQKWELVRTEKGKGLKLPERAVIEVNYDLQGEESADPDLVDEELVAAPESVSSHAPIAMPLLPIEHDSNVFEVGTIVAETGERDAKPNKQRIRMWLVMAPQTAAGLVNCIRVKSFGGQGIEGSLAAFCPLGYGADVDDQRSKQRLINAHAVLHIRGSPVPRLPAGLTTKKLALAVEMNPELPSSILRKKSCALFTTARSLSCKSHLVVIGRLTKFSTAAAEIYYRQMFEPDG